MRLFEYLSVLQMCFFDIIKCKKSNKTEFFRMSNWILLEKLQQTLSLSLVWCQMPPNLQLRTRTLRHSERLQTGQVLWCYYGYLSYLLKHEHFIIFFSLVLFQKIYVYYTLGKCIWIWNELFFNIKHYLWLFCFYRIASYQNENK